MLMEESSTNVTSENISINVYTSSNNNELTKIFKCPALGCDNVLKINMYESNRDKHNYVSVYCPIHGNNFYPISKLSDLKTTNENLNYDNKCFKHNKEKFIAFCKICGKDLCKECLKSEKEHNNKILYFENIKIKKDDLCNLKYKIMEVEEYIKKIENTANTFLEKLENLKNEIKINLIKFKNKSYNALYFSKKILDFYMLNEENNLNFNTINNVKKLKFNNFEPVPDNLNEFIIFLKRIEILDISNNILTEIDKQQLSIYDFYNNTFLSQINYLKLIKEEILVTDSYTLNIKDKQFDLFTKYDNNNNLKDYLIYFNNSKSIISIYDIKNFQIISRYKVKDYIDYIKIFTYKKNFYYIYTEKNYFYINDIEHNPQVNIKIFSNSFISSFNYIEYDNGILFVFSSYNSENLKFYLFNNKHSENFKFIKISKYINNVNFFKDNNKNEYLIVSGKKLLKCYYLKEVLNQAKFGNKKSYNNDANNNEIEEFKNYYEIIKEKNIIDFRNNEFIQFVVTKNKINNNYILIVSNSNNLIFIDFIEGDIIKFINILSTINTSLCIWNDDFLIYNDGRDIKITNINENILISNKEILSNKEITTTLLKRKITYLGDCLISHDNSGQIVIWNNDN
jgi:hypothetical protein